VTDISGILTMDEKMINSYKDNMGQLFDFHNV